MAALLADQGGRPEVPRAWCLRLARRCVSEAKAEYTRFLELKPDHKLAPTVRERLAKLGS